MQLPIESWLASTDAGDDALEAFREGTLCYKAAAYRSALLASYLGWGLCLRGRMLRATAPSGIPPGQWQQIQARLRSDDSWDAATFDATQCKSPAPVFLVSDDLRRQVLFWKDRRNDAAHFKDNELGAPHVEAFWMFVRSNLPKFVPNGSAAALLAEIVKHFDPAVTPPNTDITPVVVNAPAAILKQDLRNFLDDLVGALTLVFGNLKIPRRSELAKVHHALLRLGDEQFTSETAAHLRAHPDRLVDVLRLDPSLVTSLAFDPSLVRRLWRELLFASSGGLATGGALPVFAALLRNGMIPAPQQREANEWVAERLGGELPTQADVRDLAVGGFFDAVKRVAFEDRKLDRFDWGNPNATLVRWLLEIAPLEDSTVAALCSVFASQPYPNQARDAIRALFASNPEKKAEFVQKATTLGLTAPADLQ